MRPPHAEPFGSQRTEHDRSTFSPTASASASTRGIRSEDSWVDISSRPSSSSLSSTANDIITTGLSIRPRGERLSRHLRASAHDIPNEPRATSATGSSQDEYEESESESDRVMSSSNEDIYAEEGADDDDTSTALGVGSMGRVFTPQPNAFSHPPSSHPRPIPDSYFPTVPPTDRVNDRTITQRSYQDQIRERNRPAMSSYQPDHDAALRASLTTLLSCAAAVRPKGQQPRTTPPRASTQTTALRLVPESEIEPTPRQRRASSPKHQKRKSRESSKERQSKKARASKTTVVTEDLISPTLVSWMISAGVVLVFSAISFSAGYAWGGEVGRIEGELGLTGSNSCGQEAMRGSGTGLRRLRWSGGSSSVRA